MSNKTVINSLFPEHQDLVFHRFGVNALELYLLRYCWDVHKHLSLRMITDIHWRRKINGTVSAQFLGFYGPETWGFIMKICYIFDWNDIFSTLKKRKYTFFQHSSLKILPIPLLTFVLDNPHESFCCETKKNTKTIWIFDDFSIATVSSISLKFLAYMMSFLELGFLVEYIKNHLKAPDDENQKHPILLKKEPQNQRRYSLCWMVTFGLLKTWKCLFPDFFNSYQTVVKCLFSLS